MINRKDLSNYKIFRQGGDAYRVVVDERSPSVVSGLVLETCFFLASFIFLIMTRIIIIFESIIFPLVADLSREVGCFENPAYESTGWVLHSVLTNMLLTMCDLWNPEYESTEWVLASALMNTLLTTDENSSFW